MGVWIETVDLLHPRYTVASLLMWECGLKLVDWVWASGVHGVTPYVGVWIETPTRYWRSPKSTVTPYVGVWIETFTGCHP